MGKNHFYKQTKHMPKLNYKWDNIWVTLKNHSLVKKPIHQKHAMFVTHHTLTHGYMYYLNAKK